MQPADILQAMKARRLLETLMKDSKRLYETLKTNVWPLIEGRDHRRLQLYYAVVEKIPGGRPEAQEAQQHRAVLRIIAKILPGHFSFFVLRPIDSSY